MTNKKRIYFYSDKDIENIIESIERNYKTKFINQAIRIYNLLSSYSRQIGGLNGKYSDIEIISAGIKALKEEELKNENT